MPHPLQTQAQPQQLQAPQQGAAQGNQLRVSWCMVSEEIVHQHGQEVGAGAGPAAADAALR